MPSTVLTSVTASAPPSRAASAIGDEVGDVRAELRPPRSAARRGGRHRPRAVASAEWAKRSRAASVFGHERFTSTATTSAGASASSAAAASYSATRATPDRRDDPRAGVERAAAGRARSHAATPGPCRPTLLIIPPVVSCTRSGGLPAHGSADSDFTTTAPSAAEVDVGRQLGAVAGRARRGEDRVGQRHRPDRGGQVDGGAPGRLIRAAAAGGRGRRRRGTPAGCARVSSWAARSRMPLAAARPGRRGGEARDALHGRLGADVGAVGAGAAAARAVDDDLHLLRADQLDRVGAGGLAHLGDARRHRDAVGLERVGGAGGGGDREARPCGTGGPPRCRWPCRGRRAT